MFCVRISGEYGVCGIVTMFLCLALLNKQSLRPVHYPGAVFISHSSINLAIFYVYVHARWRIIPETIVCTIKL